MADRVLITGGNGFIAAWIAKRLAGHGLAMRMFDLREDRSLATAIAGPEIANACEWIAGDIASRDQVHEALRGCQAVIHLAGMLTPDCKTDPIRGAEVNLIGTLHVFEAARKQGVHRILYTSSAGVFGPDQGDTPLPTTHYGAFKLACEGSARAYWADHRVPSVGFRPYVVYGPGRTTGFTAGPTLACRAAARGEPYALPYRGSAGMVFVDDVAAAYERALLKPPEGAVVLNLVGTTASSEEILSHIRAIEPSARISVEGPALPFTPDIPEGDLRQVLPGLPETALHDGLAQTIAFYRAEASS